VSASRAMTRPLSKAVARDGDQGPRYGLLLVAVIASVAVQGAVAPTAVQQIVVNALLGLSLLLAFHIARAKAPVMIMGYTLAAAGVAVAVLRAGSTGIGDGEARLMSAALVALGPPAVGVGVVRSLRASRTVGIEAVMGVLALYMLIGMLFAFVFGAIDRLGDDPFFAGEKAGTVANCLYYSFTTLSTVGYGDFTARSDLGHTLSVFEALTGQIYLVTVVSLIVSNLGRRAAPR
jgi:hypothetical protein